MFLFSVGSPTVNLFGIELHFHFGRTKPPTSTQPSAVADCHMLEPIASLGVAFESIAKVAIPGSLFACCALFVAFAYHSSTYATQKTLGDYVSAPAYDSASTPPRSIKRAQASKRF
jgi:hypothetical protein